MAAVQICRYSPRMSRKPVYFLAGFIVGAVVSLLWNAMPTIRAGATPPIPGIWLDIAAQAAIIGLLLGLVAIWFSTWRRNRN
jgi:membrane associated rhomboid family serine protease